MVPGFVVSGAPRARHGGLVRFVALLCGGMLVAQEPAAPAAPVAPAPAAAPAWGKVLADGTKTRCWPSTAVTPPAYDDVLAKDEVVALGRSENGYREVLLPLGPLGYVSKKFAESAADGTLKTKGTKVSFRYRPSSKEAPVTQLADGAALWAVGEQDEWWQVRAGSVEAWVLDAEVQVLDAADPLVANGDAALRARHRGQVQARLDRIAAELQKLEQDKLDLAAVAQIEAAFVAEQKKEPAAQQYPPLVATLDQLGATFSKESSARPAIAALKSRIDAQQLLAESAAVIAQKPVIPAEQIAAPEPVDPLARFARTGWLRYRSLLTQPGVYYLERGGKRECVLTCSTMRYDLSLLVDLEVGVIGPVLRAPQADGPQIDVERIEILGVMPK
jgi:hypothetical protein